jgi:hypothetical protein
MQKYRNHYSVSISTQIALFLSTLQQFSSIFSVFVLLSIVQFSISLSFGTLIKKLLKNFYRTLMTNLFIFLHSNTVKINKYVLMLKNSNLLLQFSIALYKI